MKEILVITGQYYPSPSANGACIGQILKIFGEKNYYAHIVSMTPNSEEFSNTYCKVYPICLSNQVDQKSLLSKMNSRIEKLLYYPLFIPEILNKALRICNEIIKTNNIEFVICVQRPASSGFLGLKLKKVYSSIPVLLYELDSITDCALNYQGWTRYLRNRNSKLEKKIYNYTDLIIHLESHRRYYNKKKYEKFSYKSIYVDIPLINENSHRVSNLSIKQKKKKTLIYSGVLMKEFRNPKYLLDVLKALQISYPFEIDFYSRGNCEVLLKSLEQNEMKGVLFTKGYVNKEILDNEIAEADLLVSIGNDFKGLEDAVPSKIFYYMSMGKPILHIAPSPDDLCISYLQKYPNALILYQSEDVNKSISTLISFLESLDGSLVDFMAVKDTFIENTPEYTVEKVLEFLN